MITQMSTSRGDMFRVTFFEYTALVPTKDLAERLLELFQKDLNNRILEG